MSSMVVAGGERECVNLTLGEQETLERYKALQERDKQSVRTYVDSNGRTMPATWAGGHGEMRPKSQQVADAVYSSANLCNVLGLKEMPDTKF